MATLSVLIGAMITIVVVLPWFAIVIIPIMICYYRVQVGGVRLDCEWSVSGVCLGGSVDRWVGEWVGCGLGVIGVWVRCALCSFFWSRPVYARVGKVVTTACSSHGAVFRVAQGAVCATQQSYGWFAN